MILLTGAAGKTGRAVLSALVNRGAKVRCLVRRPDAGDHLLAMGACERALGSMSDEVALVAAMAQCESIYHIAPNVDAGEEAYGAAMLRAARSSGLRHVVYHSVLHPQIEAMPHHWAKLRVEEQILASGLPFTILRPTAYMQNILAAVQRAIDDGIYVTPYPVDARLSLIASRCCAVTRAGTRSCRARAIPCRLGCAGRRQRTRRRRAGNTDAHVRCLCCAKSAGQSLCPARAPVSRTDDTGCNAGTFAQLIGGKPTAERRATSLPSPSRRGSDRRGPTICRPTGRLLFDRPAGTEAAGKLTSVMRKACAIQSM